MSDAVDRRDFGRMLAAGTALGVGRLARGDEADSDGPVPDGAEDAAPGDEPFGPPPLPVLMVEYVRQRYPHEKLVPEVLERIESDAHAALFRGERLARYPFRNFDEPAPVFSAYRAAE